MNWKICRDHHSHDILFDSDLRRAGAPKEAESVDRLRCRALHFIYGPLDTCPGVLLPLLSATRVSGSQQPPALTSLQTSPFTNFSHSFVFF